MTIDGHEKKKKQGYSDSSQPQATMIVNGHDRRVREGQEFEVNVSQVVRGFSFFFFTGNLF